MQPLRAIHVKHAMRSVLIGLALAAACASAPSSDPLNAFRYRPERVPKPGTVVQYVKSNLDGTKPSLVSLYFADHDDVEVSRSEAGTDESADVKAHLDWKRFIADRLDTGALHPNGVREQRGTLTIGRDELVASVDSFEQRLSSSVHPLYVYNFDLMALNVMLPHLRNPKRDFTVAFVEPTFGAAEGAIVIRGRATAKYMEDEEIEGRRARRYHLSGPGLANSEAMLWVDAGDGLIDLVESPLPNNPDWNSFRLARRGTTAHMSWSEWEGFKRSHVGVGVGSMQ
jgi:hypothetical protein